MVPKVRKETPAPPNAKAKTQDQEGSAEGHPQPRCHLLAAQNTPVPEPAQTALESTPRIKQDEPNAAIEFPLTPESAAKTEDRNTLVFTVDVKANKQQAEQVSRTCATLTWPQLTPSPGPMGRRHI